MKGFSAAKYSVLCAMVLVLHTLVVTPAFSSDPATWPALSFEWGEPDSENYYVDDTHSFGLGTVWPSCYPPDCAPVHVYGDHCDIRVDGEIVAGCGGNLAMSCSAPPLGLSEGVHTAQVSGVAQNLVDGSERSFSFSRNFYVDKSSPTITLTAPENGAIISTKTAIVILGEVADSGSKMKQVDVVLYTGGSCQLRKSTDSAPADSILWRYCDEDFPSCDFVKGPMAHLFLRYDLADHAVYPETGDCVFGVDVWAHDRLSHREHKYIQFLVDRTPPEIAITTSPGMLSISSPAISGTVMDRAGGIITSMSLEIAQLNWRGTTTYWNGADWDDAPAMIALEIPPGTTSYEWSYAGLNEWNIVSGSYYRITAHAEDEFDHAGHAEQEFYYNACPYGAEKAPLPETEKKFEVGDAVFRTKDNFFSGSLLGLTHAGVYIVSDSNYQKGASTETFVQRLSENQGHLLPVENSDLGHYIVHARQPAVESSSFADFTISPGKFRGTYTAKGDLDASTRDEIAWNAAMQLGKPYHYKDINWAGGPPESTGTIRNTPLGFRCDGLVIYSYMKAEVGGLLPPGIGITNWFLGSTPGRLAGRMRRSDIDIPGPANLDVSHDGEDFTISLSPKSDSSGIDQVEHFLYTNHPYGYLRQQVLSKDDGDTLAAQVRVSTCACNPGTNLVTRLVDRAGNWSLYDSALSQVVEESGPGTYIEPFQDDNPPVIDPPVIGTYEGYLAMNIPSVTDDITPSSRIPLFYRVDQPFLDWEDDLKTTTLHSGLVDGHFVVPPGNHTLYLAAMDESLGFSPVVKEFRIPGHVYGTPGLSRISLKDAWLLFENLVAMRIISASDYPAGELPQGYSHLPQPLSKDVSMDADYTGGFQLALRYADHGVTPEQEPYLRLLHNGQDITQGVDRVNKVVFGYSTTASPFAVAIGGQATPDVEAPDLWPPFTTLEPIEDVYIDWQGGNFISTRTAIGLLAEDDRGGMVDTYYTPDLTETLFDTGLVPGSLGQFTTYSPGFTLAEGVRRLGYGSADAAGNYELLKEATFYVDGTPPVTRLTIDGMEYPAGAEIYVVEGGSITLDAMDPVSNGIASGVEEIAWLADIDPESCPEDDGEGEPEGPPGTCGNSRYAGPFTLAEGSHTVHYFSSDHVGNAEMRSIRISVDGTPPEVWLHVADSTMPDGGEAYLVEGDSITLEAFDPVSNGVASGLNEAEYLIDVTFDSCPPEEEGGDGEGEGDGEEGEDGEDEEEDGPRGTCGNSGYEGPFMLTPGTHTVYYLAHDMVMNASAVR
ncbi:MAG TPA: hypothetical protein PK523_06630, partial [Elusimicrobiales bacterium]|nr:hypothetical protein [Elusimicrobiales bacterium]